MSDIRNIWRWLVISGVATTASCSQEAPLENTGDEQAQVTIGSVTQEARLTAEVSLGAQLGLSVGISGNTLIAGAFRDSTTGPGTGALFAFDRVDGVWSAPTRLTPPGACNFGESVAFDGDTAFAFGGCTIAGEVAVFQRSGGAWGYTQTLAASDAGERGAFGFALAIQGDVALIGDPGRDAAYVFSRLGGVWTQQAKLTPSESAQAFGWSVALDGGTALIGAQQANGFVGSAFVFTGADGTWTERAKLVAPSPGYPFFGSGAALRGDTLLVSSGGPSSTIDSGAVHVFVGGGATWTFQATLVPADGNIGDGFGTSIDYEDDVAIIGSPLDYHEEADLSEAGSAYLFSRTAGTWAQEFRLTASDPARSDQFGTSVSMSGGLVAIGAKNGNQRRGAAYAFSYTATPSDLDGDGVADGTDECPSTPPGSVVDDDGCAIAQLCPCEGPAGSVCGWRTHGEYVKCVRRTAKSFRRDGLITKQQRAQIVQDAAQSQCGRP